MKTWNICLKEKPHSAKYFAKRKAYPEQHIKAGFITTCRDCFRIRQRSYNTSDRNRALWKIYIQDTIGAYCNRCGFDIWEALDFHHTDPRNGDSPTIATMIKDCKPDSKPAESIKAKIKKCELVCANCHRLIHAELI